MNAIHFLHVLVAVIFLLCMKTSSSESESFIKNGKMMTIRCIGKERKALLLFKHDDFLQSWKKEEEDCCQWEGVVCDNHTNHVTQLHLSSLIYSPNSNLSTSFSIGSSLLDLPYLYYLDLSWNGYLEEIPEFICSLTKLVHLDLSDNIIGGSIPYQIGNLSNLQYLNLNTSYINSSIPKSIGSLNSLTYLDLSECQLYGVIPQELGNLSKLHHLDLSYNSDLTGNLEWLSSLSSLTYIDLSYININAAPLSIIWSNLIHRLPSMSVISLGDCNLTGSIPRSFVNMTALTHLDLSANQLYGTIPESFGNMTALTYLDLSSNQLNGVLPQSILNMSNLEAIFFRENNFTGPLPDFTQLSALKQFLILHRLNFLSYLDLSNNNLTGRIPSGTQLQGFNISAYEGNTGLCGKPLTTICPGDDEPNNPSSIEEENGDDITEYDRWFYISAVLGFSTTFWGIIGTLILNRRWRHAYFLFLNNLEERLYVVMAVRIARLQR